MGRVFEWRINVTSVARIYRRGITSEGGTATQTSYLIINNSTITFSRISNENDIPLVSRLSINPVSDHLNGTEVTCEDVEFTLESAFSTTVIVQANTQIKGTRLVS